MAEQRRGRARDLLGLLQARLGGVRGILSQRFASASNSFMLNTCASESSGDLQLLEAVLHPLQRRHLLEGTRRVRLVRGEGRGVST